MTTIHARSRGSALGTRLGVMLTIALALILGSLALGGSATAATGSTASVSHYGAGSGVGREPTFSPGRFGELVPPLTAQQAVRTGLMAWTNGPCGRRLDLVAPYSPQVFAFTRVEHKITKVIGFATQSGTYRTQADLGVGSTLREIRANYGERLSPVQVGLYDVRYVEVRDAQRSLVFLFTDGVTGNASRVTGLSVAHGTSITGWDGC